MDAHGPPLSGRVDSNKKMTQKYFEWETAMILIHLHRSPPVAPAFLFGKALMHSVTNPQTGGIGERML